MHPIAIGLTAVMAALVLAWRLWIIFGEDD
jgi:hypothetical protein